MVRLVGGDTIVIPTRTANNNGASSSSPIKSLTKRATTKMSPQTPTLKSPIPKNKMGIKRGPTPVIAKPSEIRAAAKAERDRKENFRSRESEAQMRMQKIKDEISFIKRNESAGDTPKSTPKASPKAPPRGIPKTSSAKAKPFDEHYEDSQIGEELSFLAEETVGEESSKQIGQLVMNEMSASFALLSMSDADISEAAANGQKRSSISTEALVLSPEPPRRSQLRASKSGHLRRVHSSRGLIPVKRPSNLVPEMRRRAMQRDLLFDDDHVVLDAKNYVSSSTHSPSPVKDLDVCWPEDEKKDNKDPKSLDKSSSFEGVPRSQAQAQPAAARISLPKPPLVSAKDAKEAAKREAKAAKEEAKRKEERKKSEELREKLEEAKDLFQKGHDLCWKFQDPASSLAEYRQALNIRESLLGKYHEDTGRTYFWIGRSLVKLSEFDEALVAFSRSSRIFERVLMKSHKYTKWAGTAIENLFKELHYDGGMDFESYRVGLDTSIAHERAGDTCRKKGQLAQAIVEYRTAIDTIEEYHPDAADLYCKIAIILRQQGEFDRALEEYRFASEIYELSLGADHPETVNTLNQLIEKKRLKQVSSALMEKLNMKK